MVRPPYGGNVRTNGPRVTIFRALGLALTPKSLPYPERRPYPPGVLQRQLPLRSGSWLGSACPRTAAPTEEVSAEEVSAEPLAGADILSR